MTSDATIDRPVRVRFAPSPTGTPHIGNLRQALFDWLFARHTGGSFVLRVEDTDRTRFVPTALDEIYESLSWLGLEPDEGPRAGGDFGPYFQSERLPLYQDAARLLIAAGHAYECYCTPERLDEVRNRLREQKLPPRYDRRCRTDEGRAVAKLEAGDRRPVVRFAMPNEGETIVPDYVRGDIRFENASLDDAVLMKSDGYPTYHLAMPVDDHAMQISHVIRNEEWLPSAPLHKLLFDALGYEVPVFVHTASILGPDRSKLSKRHGAQSVLEYRDAGYLPEAVFNFLGLLGWSLDDHTEIISRDDFVRHFDLARIQKSPGIFNLDKLNWMNAEYMRAMPVEALAERLVEWLTKPEAQGGLPVTVPRPLDFAYVAQIIPLVRERVKLLSEARDMMAFFFASDGIDPDPALLLGKPFTNDRERAKLLLSEALVLADSLSDWTTAALEHEYMALQERLEASRRDFFGLMRVAITGRTVSPPLFESMELVGRERCIFRLREAVNVL